MAALTRTPYDPDLRRKALEVLRNGRVTVLRAEQLGGHPTRPMLVLARVEASPKSVGLRYREVTLVNSKWSCSLDDGPCKHVVAVQLVTGHGA